MFCPHCGIENNDDVTYCHSCGKEMFFPEEKNTLGEGISPTKKTVKLKLPNITKTTLITVLFCVLLAACYVALSLFMITIFTKEGTIGINSVFEKEVYKSISLKEYCNVLMNGNAVFNSTIVSTMLSIGMYLAVYGIAPIAGIAFLSTMIGKKKCFTLHILSVLYSVLSATLLALIVPISVRFVPNLKLAFAQMLVMHKNDVGKFEYNPLLIYAAIIVVATIISFVLTIVINKRRKEK